MSFSLSVPGTDTALVEQGGRLVADDITFDAVSEGIWDLVRPERRPILDSFAADYAAVRQAENREMTPAELQTLPIVRPDHPLAAVWHERALSHQRFKAAISTINAGAMIDIGSGCGWLAADLARDDWQAAAVDVTVEGGDGLASARYHGADLLLARAEMEALPFTSNSVDLAVFNASLHYAANIAGAIDEAARVVRPGGSIVVFDSPVFDDATAGRDMVHEFAAEVRSSFGLEAAAHEGPGFVSELDLVGYDFDRTETVTGVRKKLQQWRGARKAGRETATRPMLITTIGVTP